MLLQHYFRPSRWLLAIPLAVVALLAWTVWAHYRPEETTGGSTAGQWFGILGYACLVWTFFMLPNQRRREARGQTHWPRAHWLRGHLWVALLATVLILCHTSLFHGGTRLGGRLETVLMIVFGLTLLTGFFGMAVQHLLPRRLAAEEEVPLCQLPHLCQRWVHEADDLIDQVCEKITEGEKGKALERTYRENIRPFLQEQWPTGSPLSREGSDLSAIIGTQGAETARAGLGKVRDLCLLRQRLLRQQRLHWWLHSWLLLHVPLAVALLFLGVVHGLVSVFF
jgi:hypothetical protein